MPYLTGPQRTTCTSPLDIDNCFRIVMSTTGPSPSDSIQFFLSSVLLHLITSTQLSTYHNHLRSSNLKWPLNLPLFIRVQGQICFVMRITRHSLICSPPIYVPLKIDLLQWVIFLENLCKPYPLKPQRVLPP